MRLFIAIEVPDDTRAVLADVQTRQRTLLPGVRWTQPGNLHLTLRFLGETDDARVPVVADAVREVAATHGTFALHLGPAGVFPHVSVARVLWAGLHGDIARLSDLAAAVEAAVQRAGFAAAVTPFAPHITLGRIAGAASREDWSARLAGIGIPPLPFTVGTVTLMRSERRPEGAVYTPLTAAPLAGAG